MQAIIKNLSVIVKEQSLTAIIVSIDGGIELTIPAALIKNATTNLSFEYEILVGQSINFDFYEKGEFVDKTIVDLYSNNNLFEEYDFLSNNLSLGPRKMAKYPDTILKTFSLNIHTNFETFRKENLHRKRKPQPQESIILGMKVLIRFRNQEVILILNNAAPITVKASLLKKSSQLQPHEFEMLIGEKICYSYFSVGDIIDATGNLCEYPKRLYNIFEIVSASSQEIKQNNSHKKYPFLEIISIKNSRVKGYVEFKTSNNRSFSVQIRYCNSGFSWEFYFLVGAFILPLDDTGTYQLNNNMLLRIPSSFFIHIKEITEQTVSICQNWYNYCVYDPPYEGRQKYTNQDFIDDALGGETSAGWNLD